MPDSESGYNPKGYWPDDYWPEGYEPSDEEPKATDRRTINDTIFALWTHRR